MLYRCILPDWVEDTTKKKVVEGELSEDQLSELNCAGYNIYFLPNHPSHPVEGNASGADIDVFNYVFVDMDLKDEVYKTKEEFVTLLKNNHELMPSFIVDTGNGIHAYWRVVDLNAASYLRLCRRLIRLYSTDETVCKLIQLMRCPEYNNTKDPANYKRCEIIFDTSAQYTPEQMDKLLPKILPMDEEFCQRHYDSVYNIRPEISVSTEIPVKFKKLLKQSKEIKRLFAGTSGDRSGDDFRLAHLLHADGFTEKEAMSVLVNCGKASSRSPHHCNNYARNIVDKVWTFEDTKNPGVLANSVRNILKKGTALQGERLPCHPMFDGTACGFRLTHVMGLVGGAGSGKTTVALNYFWHFVKLNPEYIHLFVSLEQPEGEFAMRWNTICEGNDSNHDKVHVLGNYNPDGTYKNLSLADIEEHVVRLEKETNAKVGCVCIDHVGVLKKENQNGEFAALSDIFYMMKAVAKRTNTFLIMQSQTSREKAGIGDLELDKDAAFGSSTFEWFCDWVVTTWQPLRRIYPENPGMTITAFKMPKMRHKNALKDRMNEEAVYALKFNPVNERLDFMTTEEKKQYDLWSKKADILRNKDRKREPTRITEINLTQEEMAK